VRTVPKKFLISLIPPFFILFNILVFGPYTIFRGNLDEFVLPLASILKRFFLPGLILLLILTAVGILLSKKWHQRYISISFVFGMLIWLQGNILIWKYGLLDGQGIDWTKNVWQGWLDLTIWTVILVIGHLFYRHIYKIAASVCILMITLQLLGLVFMSFRKPEIWQTAERYSLPTSPPKGIFEFSSKLNVIQFVLDGFQSDIFQDVIDERIDHFYNSLEGFTFFKETTGSFPTTYMSVPAYFSGQVYKNNIPKREFLKKVTEGKTIGNVLYDRGFEVDYVAGYIYSKDARSTNCYKIAIPYGVTKKTYELANAALMLDIVLFRHAPHFLKKVIYNGERWLIQPLLTRETDKLNLRYFSHKAFLDEIIKKGSANRSKPVYKYLHLMLTHSPVVVNEKCEYAENLKATRKNRRTQARCTLDQFIEFLNKLKQMGIYDSSLIILHADHGAGQKVKMKNIDRQMDTVLLSRMESLSNIAGFALALLAVKSPFSKGALKISEAQVELTDIPQTISSILDLNEKFDGQSIFDIEAEKVRERKFYNYKWRSHSWQSEYFDHLDEFIITGSVFDMASWQLGLTYHSPKSSYKTQKIDSGTEESNRFKRF